MLLQHQRPHTSPTETLPSGKKPLIFIYQCSATGNYFFSDRELSRANCSRVLTLLASRGGCRCASEHLVTWLWLQEAGITRRRTDLAARVSSRADKYSAVAGDAVKASGGASITTVYRSAADPADSRSVHTYRYVETQHVFDASCNN